MAFVWNTFGAYSMTVALVAWALAWLVFAIRPTRRQNRLLALALLFEGIYLAGGTGLIYLTDDVRTVAALQMVNGYGYVAFIVTYLALLGTLPTPLSRPLRTRGGRAGLIALLVAGWTWLAVRPAQFVVGVEAVAYAPYDAVLGPGTRAFVLAIFLLMLFALVVAFDAWRRAAPGSMARTQAAYFLLAFGVRDLIAGTDRAVRSANYVFGSQLDPPTVLAAEALGLHGGYWFPTHILAFVLLLSYAILKVQLFDVDLRLKFALRQSTVAAMFVAAFLVATEGAQLLFGADNPWFGIAAAALLVFALAPLQRLGERVSDAAMPRVRARRGVCPPTKARRVPGRDRGRARGRRGHAARATHARKTANGAGDRDQRCARDRAKRRSTGGDRLTYWFNPWALLGLLVGLASIALADGEVTDRERDMLAALADPFEITSTDGLAIEREAARQLGGGA